MLRESKGNEMTNLWSDEQKSRETIVKDKAT